VDSESESTVTGKAGKPTGTVWQCQRWATTSQMRDGGRQRPSQSLSDPQAPTRRGRHRRDLPGRRLDSRARRLSLRLQAFESESVACRASSQVLLLYDCEDYLAGPGRRRGPGLSSYSVCESEASVARAGPLGLRPSTGESGPGTLVPRATGISKPIPCNIVDNT
jgi:hypothetical protein